MGYLENVHPVAALFPMLPDDELEELAADIKEHGLLDSIELDKDGQLIDGRNRLKACELAGVEPRFSLYEGSGVAVISHILSKNQNRRHQDKTHRAITAAKIYLQCKDNYDLKSIRAFNIAKGHILSL